MTLAKQFWCVKGKSGRLSFLVPGRRLMAMRAVASLGREAKIRGEIENGRHIFGMARLSGPWANIEDGRKEHAIGYRARSKRP
jgi:hypothetical protein